MVIAPAIGPIVGGSLLLAFPDYLAFIALIFIMPLYLARLRGFSALETGLMMMPQPVGVLIGSQIIGRALYRRVGPRRLVVVAMLLAGVNGVQFSFVGLSTPPAIIVALMFTRGLVMAGLFISVQTLLVAALPFFLAAVFATLIHDEDAAETMSLRPA